MTAEPTTITVGGERPYDVVVGTDLLGLLPAALGDAEQVAVLHSLSLGSAVDAVLEHLHHKGFHAYSVRVPDGEAAKALAVAGECWDAFGRRGLTRSDAVVSFGGGAVTDLAGWVAAAWLRGVRVVHVPTTVLGMVDAAVGGKTGINTAAGKNLVGAFHPPALVLCDLSLLASLPRVDLVAGLGEVVKCGFIADPVILDLIERDPGAASTVDGPVLRELVELSIRVKASVVGMDLREAGPRESLNYGHTLAHAIEKREDYSWRHGEAVAVGLVFAAELSRRAAGLDDATAARHADILSRLGLPTGYAGDAWPELHAAMYADKKARGSRLRFVTLPELGRTDRLTDPDPDLLAECYAAAVAR